MPSAQTKFLLSSSTENLIRLESVLERRKEIGASPEFDAIIAAMLNRCRIYREHYLQHGPIIRKVIADEAWIGGCSKPALSRSAQKGRAQAGVPGGTKRWNRNRPMLVNYP